MNQPNPDIERKLVTILSADVAEYSRLMAENEELTLKVFREHKAVFESLVALHRGRIFNTAGDAILAEFNSAVEAVRCATEIQSALRTRNEKMPKHREVRFRIGVNLGDVIVQGTDLLGDGVNIAARLQAGAEPGGVCISGSVYDQVASKLSMSVQSLGEKSYKNIPHPVRTFSVMTAGGSTQSLPVSRKKMKLPHAWIAYTAAGVVTLAIFAAGGSHFLKPVVPETAAKKSPPEAAAAVAQALPIPAHFDRPFAPAKGENSPAKWTVDPNGNQKTIASALAAAAPGDVIEVLPGVYPEHLSIKKDITIRGLPDTNGKLGVRLENSGGETIDVVDGKVFLENLIVILSPAPGAVSPSSVLVRGGNLNMRNVVAFCGGDAPAIAFSLRFGEANVENSEFTGRRGIDQMGGKLFCNECVADRNQDEGAVIMNQQRDKNFETVFKNFHAAKNGQHGLAVMDDASVFVQGCQFTENGINGAQVTGNGEMKLSDCQINHNRENGVVAAGTAKVEFLGGAARENTYSGIAGTQKSALTIRDADLSENGEFGFATLDVATALSEKNKISGNRSGASYRAPASAGK